MFLFSAAVVISGSSCGSESGPAEDGGRIGEADARGADGSGEPVAEPCAVVPVEESGGRPCAFYTCAQERIAGGGCPVSGYVMGFACKYAKKYLEDVYDTLTPQGQLFLDEVYVCLQSAIEGLANAGANQGDDACAEVEVQGFGAHVPCYVQSGFCKLPSDDVLKIALAIEPADLAHPLQQAASGEIFTECQKLRAGGAADSEE
jgi:hypothetical protein